MSGTFGTIGITGLETLSGEIWEITLRAMRGDKGRQNIAEMSEQDSVIFAILGTIDKVLRQTEWNVRPYGTLTDPATPDDEINAEFVQSCLDDMSVSWPSQVSEILSFIPFGWSWHEVLYKRRQGPGSDATTRSRFDDGMIGWRRFAIRAQQSLWQWEFDDDGGIQAMIQRAAPDYKLRTIPIQKSLLFRTTAAKGNPEGRSMLLGAYRPYYLKRHIENVEAIGIERDMAGFPIMLVPPKLLGDVDNLDADELALKATLLQFISNVRRDKQEGALLPAQYDADGNLLYDFKLMTTGGQRQFDTNQVIGRHNLMIAISMLADFILLGHEKVGSFALSSDKTDLFALAMGAFLDEIADVVNNHAIPRLFTLNGLPVDRLPVLEHGDIESRPLEQISNYLSALAAAGMLVFPDDDLSRHLLELADLPVPVQSGTEPNRPSTLQDGPEGDLDDL